jgi:MFS family permease
MVLIKRREQVNFGFIMTMLGFSMTFVVAEVTPLFLITVFTIIAFDINASGYIIWILVSQLIAVAAIAPFVGTISDLLGRKTIVLISLGLTVVGNIVIGTTHHIAGLLAGQVILGLSIGIQLLTSIAAVTELVPTSRRGITIGYVVCGFIPFAPASLYGQYIAAHNWRYISILLGGWGTIAFVVLAIFYRPPPRANALGLTNRELLGRIDYFGSFLSIVGLVLFLTGLNWGGQDYAWSSAPVISTLTLGIAFWVAFFLWERFGTKHPMFPSRLAESPKLFAAVCMLCLTSGINYIPVVVFWVIQSYTVYTASFQQAGVYLLPIGFCIAGGAIMSAVLLTAFPKRIHIILTIFCVCQTVGKLRRS